MTTATWPLPADGLVQDSSIACAALDAAISKPNIEVTNRRFFIKYHPFFSIELNPPQTPGTLLGLSHDFRQVTRTSCRRETSSLLDRLVKIHTARVSQDSDAGTARALPYNPAPQQLSMKGIRHGAGNQQSHSDWQSGRRPGNPRHAFGH
ncbi:MAG TPA: hypothetical protein VNM70_01225, partial [Burkholderiales bacterium]|nr:hypothetical protein [Burkholderiales bacterium]